MAYTVLLLSSLFPALIQMISLCSLIVTFALGLKQKTNKNRKKTKKIPLKTPPARKKKFVISTNCNISKIQHLSLSHSCNNVYKNGLYLCYRISLMLRFWKNVKDKMCFHMVMKFEMEKLTGVKLKQT